jgi:hypothetical protein
VRPWLEVEAEAARASVTADQLPSNRALPNFETAESQTQGWTVQRPYEHRRYPIEWEICVVCGEQFGPNDLTRHDCLVARAVGA